MLNNKRKCVIHEINTNKTMQQRYQLRSIVSFNSIKKNIIILGMLFNTIAKLTSTCLPTAHGFINWIKLIYRTFY